MHGIVNINKPKGWSSFEAVKYVRKFSGGAKTGHAGTLDPSATGVLLILLGEACKTFDLFRYEKKEYEAKIKLGWKSSTWDAAGELEECQTADISISAIEDVLERKCGHYVHRVPDFSAKKHKGETFYKIMRKGGTPPERFQKSEIYGIELMECGKDSILIRVQCSSGTYIRTLAVDIAAALGTSGYLEELVRTRINGFSLKDSAVPEKDKWAEGFSDINQALRRIPHIVISDSAAAGVKSGLRFTSTDVSTESGNVNGRIFPVFSESGVLCALSKQEDTVYSLERVFNLENS